MAKAEDGRRTDLLEVVLVLLVVGHGGEPGRDDEELGGHEVELGGEREEAGVERRLGLGLFKGLAVVEVSVGEDTAEAARQGREVSVRCWRN